MVVKFALLGAGRIGKTHAEAIHAHSGARLVSLFDPMEAAAQALSVQYDCAIQTPEQMMENTQIDVVAICTPTHTHADFIEIFAKAGKTIFCEKPIDLSIERVKTCLETVNKYNAKLMVGFNRRFDPHFKAVRQAIEENKIGVIEQVIISSRDPDLPSLDYIKSSGGIFKDMTIHDFDMARFLLNEPIESVFATASVLVNDAIIEYGDFDSAMVVLCTASGKLAHINNSQRASYGYDQRTEVHGSLGMVSGQNPPPLSIEFAGKAGYHQPPLHDFFMTRYKEAYKNEVDALINSVKEDRPLSPTGEDGLISLAIAEAAILSNTERRMVKLSEII